MCIQQCVCVIHLFLYDAQEELHKVLMFLQTQFRHFEMFLKIVRFFANVVEVRIEVEENLPQLQSHGVPNLKR